jgi:hypothetical protein
MNKYIQTIANRELPRRQFIKTALVASASTFFIPRIVTGQAVGTANSRLRLAMVGCGFISGGWGRWTQDDIVAICDANPLAMAEAKKKFAPVAGAREFVDFRKMFDQMGEGIDAVIVNTPDNTHFAITMEAMQRGMHVYTEKPLTHDIWQARTLAKMAAANPKLKTIMGNQGHTFDGIREMREWYEAGILGQVTSVDTWHPGPGWKSQFFSRPASYPPVEEPIPAGFDWDLWLGPCEMIPFNNIYTTWRGFWHFGTGMLGDWFCHIGDGPVWILDLYEPTVIEAEKIVGAHEGMCPDGSVIRYDFPERNGKAACTLRWHDGGNRPNIPADWSWGSNRDPDGAIARPGLGSLWDAENGDFFLDERSNNPRLTSREKTIELKRSGALPDPKYDRIRGGPRSEWLRAIKGEGPNPGSDFAYGAKLTEIACLGVLAQRFGGRIEWDAANMRVTNRPELNNFVRPPVRKGWEYGEELWKA